ncbi:hypothetical protein [Neobacillus drentensis]|uniref:hypothetical protein n=1 Tax=Neobacillus drentensis TaxID=220684 RepID=UPI002FFECBB6
MAKKSVGRNPKLTQDEVKFVVKDFRDNVQPMGIISYSKIHSYANSLYEDKLISASTSDSFWRKEGRLGRIEVDKANRVFSETVTVSKGKEIKVPNVVDLVNKKYKNKEELLKHLIFMEKQFHESLEREKKLGKDLSELEETLQKVKSDLKERDTQNDKLQALVYRLSRILSESSNEEVRQNTEYAMKTIFSNPAAFFEFEERNKPKYEPKVIPFENSESKNKFSSRFRK